MKKLAERLTSLPQAHTASYSVVRPGFQPRHSVPGLTDIKIGHVFFAEGVLDPKRKDAEDISLQNHVSNDLNPSIIFLVKN